VPSHISTAYALAHGHSHASLACGRTFRGQSVETVLLSILSNAMQALRLDRGRQRRGQRVGRHRQGRAADVRRTQHERVRGGRGGCVPKVHEQPLDISGST